jgi:hypothetical protein
VALTFFLTGIWGLLLLAAAFAMSLGHPEVVAIVGAVFFANSRATDPWT